MATFHHNVSGELTKELIAPGSKVKVSSITFTNVQKVSKCKVDLYIEKKLLGKFYIVKTVEIPIQTTLILDDKEINFSNDEFGLFIKLTKLGSGSGDPAVDVIIS